MLFLFATDADKFTFTPPLLKERSRNVKIFMEILLLKKSED